jgi:hypothetical protein
MNLLSQLLNDVLQMEETGNFENLGDEPESQAPANEDDRYMPKEWEF